LDLRRELGSAMQFVPSECCWCLY